MKNVLFSSKSTNSMTSDNVVEISTVSLNQDQSHAHAYWSSEPIETMLKNLILAGKQHVFLQHQSAKPQDLQKFASIAPVDAREGYQLALKMEKNLSTKLQRYEGKFRSHIIRTINMRRVPRIFFAADKDTKMLIEQLKAIAELKPRN